MSTSSLLIQNISDLFTMSSFMTGGKLNRNVDPFTNKKNNVIFMLFTILLMLLLKGLIVFIIYNFLTPKLMESLSINNSFKEISFPEALLMVILFNTLFS
jgi:ABC-type protease/lipase transport system fused ATPase/permease subunit